MFIRGAPDSKWKHGEAAAINVVFHSGTATLVHDTMAVYVTNEHGLINSVKNIGISIWHSLLLCILLDIIPKAIFEG